MATTIHETWVPKEEEFLPELLQEIGYRTKAVGKWHLGHGNVIYSPVGRGFDEFFGPYAGAGDHYEHTISGSRFVDFHHDRRGAGGSGSSGSGSGSSGGSGIIHFIVGF